MGRGRAWRRHINEIKTKKKLKKLICAYRFWRFEDANGVEINDDGNISGFIGTDHEFKAKSGNIYYYLYKKPKYSHKRNSIRGVWVDSSDHKTRSYQKKEFRKLLKEYGII